MNRVTFVKLMAGTFALILLAGSALATPYVPLEQAEAEAAARKARIGSGPSRVSGELDEIDGYLFPMEYFATLSWLPSLQVGSEDPPNLGGMREGEEDLNIIQTDNTQEALRDWAFYANMTGDTTRFRQNILDAWTYTLNFPAWEEEGGGDPNYYRTHNAGWGLVAAMEYVKAYGDSTYLWYGDSCASYLVQHPLGISGTLNPLSAAFGAGALAQYALWRGRTDWHQAAVNKANQVKAWIDASPNRLNDNETWAMSGGTAMWGVVTALYSADTTGSAAWITPKMDYMDTYSGPGNWNNSWTVWYGHAWMQIHRILGNSLSYARGLEVLEYMLDEVHLDDDAGVPGTEGHSDNDQAWTSAYLLWYTLEPTFEVDTTAFDVATAAVSEPIISWPLIAGSPVNLTVQVANGGLQPLGTDTQLGRLWAILPDGSVTDTVSYSLGFGQVADISLPTGYVPPADSSEISITMIASTAGDGRPGNDSLTVRWNVVEGVTVSGAVTDTLNGLGVEARIDWRQVGSEPPRNGWTVSDPASGVWAQQMVPGEYELTISPLQVPYPMRWGSVTVGNGDVSGVDFSLAPAKVLHISELGSDLMDRSLVIDFNQLGLELCRWPMEQRGDPSDTLGLVDLVVWSPGGTASGSVLGEHWQALSDYVTTGGKLLIAGHQWLNSSAGDTVMQNLLGVQLEAENNSSIIVFGDASHPAAQGDTLLISGVAQAQAPDDMLLLDGSERVWYHPITQDYVFGAARTAPDGYGSTLALTFGLEAINSTQFAGRLQMLDQTLTWFGLINTSATPEGELAARPAAWALAAWPNPFNPVLSINVASPTREEAILTLYDLLGRRVARWVLEAGGTQHRLQWDGSRSASGVYLLHLETGSTTLSRRVTLLK